MVLATRGTLARRDGPKAAVTDYLVGLLDVWPTVEAGYPKLPADLRAVLEAYADGVNAYAAFHPRAVTPGLLPLSGKDVLAGFVFKQPFFYGLDGELKRLTSPATTSAPPKGSNGLAAAPSRNADGATRLLVNSHQPYTGPVAWYEAVVESGQGWHVAGGFFPGAPFMCAPWAWPCPTPSATPHSAARPNMSPCGSSTRAWKAASTSMCRRS